MHFHYPTTIALFDTDASGLLFYGSLFRLTQSCFEAFLRSHAVPIEGWIEGTFSPLPVRRVEAEYLAPLRVGAPINVSITKISIGTTSLAVTYAVTRTKDDTECASATVTHVAIDRMQGTPTPLSPELVTLFARYAS